MSEQQGLTSTALKQTVWKRKQAYLSKQNTGASTSFHKQRQYSQKDMNLCMSAAYYDIIIM